MEYNHTLFSGIFNVVVMKSDFFDQEVLQLAKALLGKVLRVKYENYWLSAQIIETEAYALEDRASHASLGRTPKREALFMPPGTIYMYYARGGDSLNVSARGEGNAVLIKSAYPFFDEYSPQEIVLPVMQQLNPKNGQMREVHTLCCGQTLLCRSLGLKVKDWDKKCFDPQKFYIEDLGYKPEKVLYTQRLGIPAGRDEHLMYRLVDYKFARHCTSNPLAKRDPIFMVEVNNI